MSIPSVDLAGLLALGLIFRVIGVLEIAGVAGLLIGLTVPMVGSLAGAGLFLLLTGALMTHLRNGDGVRTYAPAVLCAALVVVYLVALYGASR
jgi:hypothetical protein